MSKNKSRNPPQHKRQQLRLIGGAWRGRRLEFADQDGLRPSGDRCRETLFNWLQTRLPGSRCLDLFAGSGALGLEAASRGAAAVELVELNPLTASVLREQIDSLTVNPGEQKGSGVIPPTDAADIRLHQEDALGLLASGALAEQRFDIVFVDPPFELELQSEVLVFVDPPFELELQSEVLRLLHQHPCLSVDAVVYVETGQRDLTACLQSGWQIDRQKRAGNVSFGLLSSAEGK